MIITRPHRWNLRQLALDSPLPFLPTCKGMGLPWPAENVEKNQHAAEQEQDALLAYCRAECDRLHLPYHSQERTSE